LKGIILIHGFGGSPYEMRPIGEYMKKYGFSPVYPLLPGHRENALTLGKYRMEEWIDYLQHLIHEKMKEYNSTSICGLSMGASLSIIIASEFEFEKLILLAPPIYIRKSGFNLIPYIGFINIPIKIANSSPNPESYLSVPLPAVYQFWRTIHKSVEAIEKINSPTLIIQGLSDPMVKPEGARFIFNRLRAKKILIFVEGGNHMLTFGETAKAVKFLIKDFLNG